MKFLHRQFKEQLKQLELSLNVNHRLINEKIEILNKHKEVLRRPKGKEEMEQLLGIQIKIRTTVDADLVKDKLPPEPKGSMTAKTQPRLLAIQSQEQLSKSKIDPEEFVKQMKREKKERKERMSTLEKQKHERLKLSVLENEKKVRDSLQAMQMEKQQQIKLKMDQRHQEKQSFSQQKLHHEQTYLKKWDPSRPKLYKRLETEFKLDEDKHIENQFKALESEKEFQEKLRPSSLDFKKVLTRHVASYNQLLKERELNYKKKTEKDQLEQ